MYFVLCLLYFLHLPRLSAPVDDSHRDLEIFAIFLLLPRSRVVCPYFIRNITRRHTASSLRIWQLPEYKPDSYL